jgi:iron(III) transport system substrate-binding protein
MLGLTIGTYPKGIANAEKIETTIGGLYKAAKKEGKVVFYSPRDVPYVQKMYTKFKEKFPGIELEHLDIRQGEIVERIITENKVGTCTIDVGFGGEATIKPLTDRGLITKYEWRKAFDIPESFVQMDGRGIVQATQMYVYAYNTNLLKNPEKFPRPVKQLLESFLAPELKGKIIVERRGWPFARLATVYTGDEWMTNYLKKLKAQEPVLCKGIGVTGNLLAAGAGHICLPLYLYQYNLLKAQGAPLGWFIMNPMSYALRLLYVTEKAPHPNAARLWAGWFCSREGAKFWEEISTQGIVLPGSGTKVRKLIEKEGIELLTEKGFKELAQSRNNMKKYRKILMGK